MAGLTTNTVDGVDDASLKAELAEIAEAYAVDRIGFCSAAVFEDVRRTLHDRKADGLSADMAFTYRNPDRATDPQRALPGAQALVVGARSYRRRREPGEVAKPTAEVAEYVWEQHYVELHAGLNAISERLRADGWKTRILLDDNALVDRAAAHRAGLGWWGKSANILIPEIGSKIVLGSVVTDAPLNVADEPMADQCGPCRRCIDSCPTDAIVADGVIDANRCLAWLVQATGVFPREHRQGLGARIYGCDECQATCPPNLVTDRREPAPITGGEAMVAVEELLTLDDEGLIERFGAWYIPKRDPRYLRRNALVVLGNVGDGKADQTRTWLDTYLQSGDDLLVSHAVWAAHVLGCADLIVPLERDEVGPMTSAELSAIGGVPR